MSPKVSLITGIAAMALLSGCVAAVLPMPRHPALTRQLQRGAVSGVPQRVGFFYAVNADCSFSGLMHLDVEKSPAHGTVWFATIKDYPSFRRVNREYYPCDRRKVRGVGVFYRSAADFTGADRFLVEGVGPKGGLFRIEYLVTVLQNGGK